MAYNELVKLFFFLPLRTAIRGAFSIAANTPKYKNINSDISIKNASSTSVPVNNITNQMINDIAPVKTAALM